MWSWALTSRAACVAVVAALGLSSDAAADGPLFLAADVSRAGRIDLKTFGPPNTHVVLGERIGGRLVKLAEQDTVSGTVFAQSAAQWRCDRLARYFEATATTADGNVYPGASFSVRTPSCRRRLAVSLPARAPAGRRVTVGIRDRWRTGGLRVRICPAGPRAKPRCRPLVLRPGQTRARASFTPRTEGRWRVRLQVGTARLAYPLAVGRTPRARPTRPARTPTILATGDSTMQGVDAFLGERLGRAAEVVSRIRPGTGISKSGGTSWLKAARIQSSSLKPRVTVVSVGANEGFPMKTPAGKEVMCCAAAWEDEYSRRARIMMRTWSRFGGRVLWMTLPAPGDPLLVARFAAVNTAISRAAAGLPRVRLVRIDSLLSPRGVFERTIVYHGRRVRVRGSDPVHLSTDGTAIAADAAVAALKRFGGLSRGQR